MKSEKTVGLPQIREAIGALNPGERRNLIAWLLWGRFETRHGDIPLKRALLGTLLGVAAFMAAEGFLFHSGWYNKYLEPNSTAGAVEYRLFWLLRQARRAEPEILVVGDSRIAEGFSARVANEAARSAAHFANMGMGGTTPRVWYYALRDLDRARDRYAAIVIAFDRYSDHDRDDPADIAVDLNYLAGRLTLRDCPGFSNSFADRSLARAVFAGCVFRGTVFRSDVLQFLSDIPDRLKRARDWRDHGFDYNEGYGGKAENMDGIAEDPGSHALHLPPGLTEVQISTAKYTLLPDTSAQTGALTAYRRRWIGGLLDLYRNSRTQFIFIQLPNAPLALPEPPEPPRFIQSVASRPKLSVIPANTFRDLQRPELFADGLHLNSHGRRIFSERLAGAVRALVAN